MNVRRSIAITASARYIEIGLQFVGGVILARLLTPEDFGIYAIAGSIALIGYLFRNFGVGQFIVQTTTLTDDILRTAFSITLAISWCIALLLVLSANWVGGFYGDPGVEQVLLLIAINFVLLPFGAISQAVLRRNMAFDKVAIISLTAAVTALIVGIVSAWLGARYLSMVWASNASTLVTVIVTTWLRPRGLPWRPGLGAFREVASFGLKVGMQDLVARGSDAATELVIGKVRGLHELGIYSRAYGVFMLFEFAFTQSIRPVVLPYLSEAKRNQASLAPMYGKIIGFISIFMLPFYVFMYFNAFDVIRTLYGDQWDAAVPVLQVLCIAGLFMMPTVFFEPLLIANGRPGLALRYQLLFQATRLGALVLLVSGELTQAALALVIGSVVKAGSAMYLARKQFGVSTADIIRQLSPALITGAFLALIFWFGLPLLHDWNNPLLRLLVVGPLFAAFWLGAVFLLKHPVADEIRKLYARFAPT